MIPLFERNKQRLSREYTKKKEIERFQKLANSLCPKEVSVVINSDYSGTILNENTGRCYHFSDEFFNEVTDEIALNNHLRWVYEQLDG